MSNPYISFKYLWQGKFSDGHIVRQHPEDKYSKHDPNAISNPSSFRDFLDYASEHPEARVVEFSLFNEKETYTVSFADPEKPAILCDVKNRYGDVTKHYELVKCKRNLQNARPIYYRRVEMNLQTGDKLITKFVVGFQGNEANGRNYKKTVDVL